MTKKFYFSICLLFCIRGAEAQINMTLQVPPSGVLLKKQLWNMVITSTAGADQLVKVMLSLQDPKNNQVVLRGVSRILTIPSGAVQLQSDDFAPIQYEYYSPIFNADRDPNGVLPVGNYLACYTITGNHNITLAENCITVAVEPLSPPLLNLPSDNSVLQISYPQFTWLPPTPKNIFTDLTYDLVVTEVLPGQTAPEAIQNNVPMFTAGRLNDIFLNYPSSAKQLDTAKLYAWQIIARNNSDVIAPSDVWTFKIDSPKPDSTHFVNGGYILLERGNTLRGTYTIENKTINIKYYSFDRDHESDVRFLTAEGKLIRSVRRRVVYGDNYLSFELKKGFESNTIYTIELVDAQKNKYTAFFRIK